MKFHTRVMGKTGPIHHKIYKHLRWVNKDPEEHAMVQLDVSLDREGYQACGVRFPGANQRRDANLRAIVDTG